MPPKKIRKQQKRIRKRILDAIIRRIEATDSLLEKLALSYALEQRNNLEPLLRQMFAAEAAQHSGLQMPRSLWSDICNRVLVKKALFPKSCAVLKDQGQALIDYRWRKLELRRSLGLGWTATQREKFLAPESIPTVSLPMLKKRWPPKDVWLSEAPTTGLLWERHFQEAKLQDKRIERKDVLISSDGDSWQKTIKAGESVIIRDAQTGQIVLVVIRNFCNHQGVLDWAIKIVQAAVNIKKSVRLDDPGKLVMNGYTSGSRNAPSVVWAKNLLQSPTRLFESPQELESFDFQVSSTYALMWNMARSKLPPEILADIDKFVDGEGVRAVMDGNGTMKGYYGLKLKEEYYEFHSAELAHPQGNYARNYSRFCHHEKNAHDYCLAWTISRLQDPSSGGNFYVADYGIKVEASTDMMVAWKGAHFHGTTLPDVDPSKLDTDFQQLGLSIATGGRLLKALREVKRGEVLEAYLFKRVAELEDEDYKNGRI
ncbi:hypothetical protein FN846DRAFT_1009128 [Sphaerosporella brunnea]|uniref:Uncharacterized protein n=1 Tax=Sphaerosporella brunnea TaxID=1250544 RepID=A0A5J5EC43_9PEZI|nr:hypothetical protein FN846DRAFT_1009128 [Sphaerosporella brunnea]